MRRNFRRVMTAALVACSAAAMAPSSTAQPPATPTKRPNVLIILVDDLGARDLGVYGSAAYATPRIDRFASQSLVMRQAYAPSPVCSPSRAGLLTGKAPERLGITTWLPGDYPDDRKLVEPPMRDGLAPEEVTLAERFRAAGYRTFLSGKWHLGAGAMGPEAQGFDINLGGGHEGQPPSYYAPYRLSHLRDGPEGEYLTDRQAADTIDFIAQGDKRPFFAFLSFYAVHTPLVTAPGGTADDEARIARIAPATQRYVREGEGWTKLGQDNAVYASMVRRMDMAVGRVLDALDRLRLADDTIVIFASDNGGLSTLYPAKDGKPSERTPTSNAPLRAGKGWLYEGGIRIPLIIRVPSTAAGESAVPVTLLDLAPTLVELARLKPLAAGENDGMSLAALLRDRSATTQRPLHWFFPHYHGSGMVPGSAIRIGDWKLIHSYEDDSDKLYNLALDADEKRNVAAANPGIVQRLRKRLDAWLRESGAVLPVDAKRSAAVNGDEAEQRTHHWFAAGRFGSKGTSDTRHKIF